MQIWFHNVPHTELAVVKGHQNWVKVTGEYLTFPGGGTQFVRGAPHYIDMIQNVSFCTLSIAFLLWVKLLVLSNSCLTRTRSFLFCYDYIDA